MKINTDLIPEIVPVALKMDIEGYECKVKIYISFNIQYLKRLTEYSYIYIVI